MQGCALRKIEGSPELSTQEQKLGATGHWALLAYRPDIGEKKKKFFFKGGGGGVMSDYRHVHLVMISERFLHKVVTAY